MSQALKIQGLENKPKSNILGRLKNMSGKKKLFILVAVALAFLLGYGLLSSKEAGSQAGIPVVTTPLTKQNIEESIILKAPLEGSESVEVVSRQHYEVAALNVKEGDQVTKGQVLAILDSENLAREIDKAQDALDLAVLQNQESLENQQRDYAKALQNLADAQRQYDQRKALFGQGAEAKETLEKAENNRNDMQRLVDGFKVENGQVVPNASQAKQLEISRKNLTQAKVNYEEARIISPINGTVTRVNIKVGRFADNTDDDKPMFVIENLENLQMKVLVSEFDIAKIAVGQGVVVTADILKGEEVQAVVARISPTGELKSSGSTERVIPTQIDIVKNNPLLIAGITAKAKIQVAEAQAVLVAPLEAILEKEDGTVQVCRVSADKTLQIVPVTLGVENDLSVEISGEGLQEGDPLVMSPTLQLTQGMKVTVANE